MRRITRRTTLVVSALVLVASGLAACEPTPPPPRPIDVYAFAHGCYALKDQVTGKHVGRSLPGWRADRQHVSQAVPFRLQATALGRYLLYSDKADLPAVGLPGTVGITTTPGPAADWIVKAAGQRLSLTNVQDGRGLAVGGDGRLTTTRAVEARWSLVPSGGCATFPEASHAAVGTPAKGASPTAPVRGYVDAHVHVSAFRFLGGRFHCGRPWSPYGVTVALEDCADHQPNGAGAAAENLFAHGHPVGTHDTDGWPSFAGWPRWDSLTHEGTYWKWIERAWRGGLRIMVNDLVENRALCEIYPIKAGTSCNEMDSARLQARDMYALQDYVDAQFKGPGKGFFRIVKTPAEARRVINDGKLAVVLGIEVSEVLDCGLDGDSARCTTSQIDQRLQELWGLGVRSLFPVHKFDNALGGTAYDDDAKGLLVNTGNKWATGRWWEPEPCPPGAPEADNTPMNLSLGQDIVYQVLGLGVAPLLEGDLPAYPTGPLCNPRGLTDLGIHVITRMAEMGMIVETDHLSVKARGEALTLLERLRYPGLVTSHSWGDATSQRRLQQLGGLVSPYAVTPLDYAEDWRRARQLHPQGRFFGIGFGTDVNGLGAQASPREGGPAARVRYPYRTWDGVTMNAPRSGTRVWDINVDGTANYGMFPDWVEDLRLVAGDAIVADLQNGAEMYLRMWSAAETRAKAL